MSHKKFPVHPANPERLCWGCDKYCAANDMMCGNGSDRTQHPFELFGEDWQSWGGEDAGDHSTPPLDPSTGRHGDIPSVETTPEVTMCLFPHVR